VWDAERGELVWVDIDAGLVHRRGPDGQVVTVDVGQPVGCAVPRAAGGLALAMRDGFGLLDEGEDAPRLVAPVERERSGARMNDGACDSRGQLWAGTMSLSGDTRTAALYRLDAGLRVQRVLPGLSISNGIGWGPDGRTLYHVDSPRRRVDAYDFAPDTGTVGGRRSVIPIAREDGLPDGLAVDEEGGIWVALWGGGAVQRLTCDGTASAKLHLPIASVTSCCFGGEDLATLFITTATRGCEHEPLAGLPFEFRPGIRGLPATPFAG
jgi:sugar lactone lactonase YvrE